MQDESASYRFLFGLVLALAACLPVLAAAHEADEQAAADGPPLILGVLDFPNSGAPDAQPAFERGVLLLHSFEYTDARAAFLEAQDIDPDFVMAIWGEAMTLNHPLWAQQDRAEALQVLARLPPPAGRRATPREQMFLDAITALYGYGMEPAPDKPARDHAYLDAMRRTYEAFPGDLEAATFYALALLGSVYERDFRVYMRAAAILEEVFAEQPRHPGAAHYLIHSYDDQIHAPLGLRPARVYATIAPAASHAQHMISHIYSSLGMWDEVVTANRKAVRVSEESMLRAGRPIAGRSKHALHWLQYALLQQGLYGDARDAMAIMKADQAAQPDHDQNLHYVLLRGSYIADDPAGPNSLPHLPLEGLSLDIQAIDRFSSGFAFVTAGDPDAAGDELGALRAMIAVTPVKTVAEGLHEDDMATSPDGMLIATILQRELEALLLYRAGDIGAAIALLAAAAADEYGRPLEYGPPYVPKPAIELLGEMLLAQGRPQEAAVEFRKSLERNTNRSLSLLGLARAQAAAGDETAAAETNALLTAQWRGDLPAFLASGYPWLGD